MIGLICLAVVSGIFCGAVANARGRDFGGWFVLGFLFPIISLLAIIGMPVLQPPPEEMYIDGDGATRQKRRASKFLVSAVAIFFIFAMIKLII